MVDAVADDDVAYALIHKDPKTGMQNRKARSERFKGFGCRPEAS